MVDMAYVSLLILMSRSIWMLHILVDRSDETVRTPLEPLKLGGDFNHKFLVSSPKWDL